jgi:hypothetical protein
LLVVVPSNGVGFAIVGCSRGTFLSGRGHAG